jgi:hypothetical protein|tara:strand:+ start:1640 stop:1903 length:264 start_codon:yes stop_codon:yes gene_type:complete
MTKEQFLSLKPGDLIRRAGMSKRPDNLLMFIKRQKVQLKSGTPGPSCYAIYHFDFYVGTITKFGSAGGCSTANLSVLYKPWKYYDKA